MATEETTAQAQDLELVRRYLADPAGAVGRSAAEKLFRLHHGDVLRGCLRFTDDPDEALELCQETLAEAARDLVHFEKRSVFEAWLFVVTRRTCLRSRRRKRFAIDSEVDADSKANGGPPVEVAFVERESETHLLEALNGVLDERERAAIWLRCIEGVSVEDIATMLNVDGAPGARGLLHGARLRLRAALEARGWRGRGPR